MDMPGMTMPHPPAAEKKPVQARPSQADRSQPAHSGHGDMAMGGVLGAYPMQREAPGTAWQPDNSEHMGAMAMSGDWTLMAHGVVNFAYDHQSGPRGDDKAFAAAC